MMPTPWMGPGEGAVATHGDDQGGGSGGLGRARDRILNRKFWKGFAHVTTELCTLYVSPWLPPAPVPAAEE